MPDIMALPPSALKAADDAKRRKATIKSHPALPGTGPAGERCRSCVNYRAIPSMGNYVYRRCALMLTNGSPGLGDALGYPINANDPACSKWEARL